MRKAKRPMSRITIATAVALGLTTLGTSASAQPRLAIPEGVTTDRFSADPWALSVDVAISNYDDVDGVVLATRFDLYGQILGQVGAHRVGGYASLPYAYILADEEDPIGKLGHLELGGLFATAAGASTDAVLRGGVAFEVTDDQDLDSLALFITGFGRLSESFISIPEVTWARVSGSLLHRGEPYFLRADLGLDVPFSEQEDGELFVRLNLAAGANLGSVALLGELSNMVSFTGESDDELLSTLGLTLRGTASSFSPVVSVVVPLDDQLQELVDFVVVVGVRSAGD
jgi:hypothetical protein